MTGEAPDGGSALVSVVIIFHNEATFLSEAIDSVRGQTVSDWELVLVDDGSTDASTALARSWAAAEPERVRYLEHPGHDRRGMSASRNLGVRAASGRYIAYLDADDRWLEVKLERQLELLADHPEARLVYGPLVCWYSWTGRPEDSGRDDLYGLVGHRLRLEPGTLLAPPRLASLIIEHKDLVPSGALFERSLFLEVGGAEERFTDNYEDAVVFLKMGLRASAYVGEQAWYLYRQYPQASDRANRAVGRPDPDRPRGDAARAIFLAWVEDYLRTESRWDPAMRRAFGRARRQLAAGSDPAMKNRATATRAKVGRAAEVAVRGGRIVARHGRLAVDGQLRRLPVDRFCDEFAFSFAAGGWELISEALRSRQQNDEVRVEQSAFSRFLLDPATNRVRDLNDLFDLSDRPAGFGDLPRFWLGTYPWGGIEPGEIGRPGPAFGWAYDEVTGRETAELWGRGRTIWYRPDDPFTIASEWDRIFALDRAMARAYRPWRARGFPLVTLLEHDDGRQRAVIVDGHHRLAVLAHRGALSVTVEIGGIIERAEADDWYHVRRGHCTPQEALRFFDAFFELDGSERFRRVSASWESNGAR